MNDVKTEIRISAEGRKPDKAGVMPDFILTAEMNEVHPNGNRRTALDKWVCRTILTFKGKMLLQVSYLGRHQIFY